MVRLGYFPEIIMDYYSESHIKLTIFINDSRIYKIRGNLLKPRVPNPTRYNFPKSTLISANISS